MDPPGGLGMAGPPIQRREGSRSQTRRRRSLRAKYPHILEGLMVSLGWYLGYLKG